MRRDQKLALVLVAPLIIVLIGLIAYPFCMSIYTSLTDKRIGLPGTFIGLRNYISLFQDEIFLQTLENTGIYTAVSVFLKGILGLTLALMLKQITHGRRWFRVLIFLPWVVPQSLGVLVWRWMFDPSPFCVLNWLLQHSGIAHTGVPWLADPFWARFSIITVNVWRGIPFFTVCFLAGLVGIPEEFYEAAKVDGANSARRFTHITLPLLRPILGIVILYSIVMTVGDFVIVQVLTAGAPLGKTHLLGTLAYQVGLAGTKIGQGAAISLFIFPVLIIGAYFLLRIILR